MDTYTQLSLSKRAGLKIVLGNGESLRSVARSLWRAASTVSRELSRCAVGQEAYDPEVALGRAKARRRSGNRKLRPETSLWAEVMERLRCGWSPEQIAGGLKHEHPSEPAKRVSHQTIYRAIYVLPKGELKKELLGLLRQAGRSRRPRSGGKKRGEVLKDFTPNQARPAAVEACLIPVH